MVAQLHAVYRKFKKCLPGPVFFGGALFQGIEVELIPFSYFILRSNQKDVNSYSISGSKLLHVNYPARFDEFRQKEIVVRHLHLNIKIKRTTAAGRRTCRR